MNLYQSAISTDPRKEITWIITKISTCMNQYQSAICTDLRKELHGI